MATKKKNNTKKATRDHSWNPPSQGTKKRNEMPSHCFLNPKEKKYPYKKKVNGEWVISRSGLRACITRAAQHGHKSIETKARRLYQRHFGSSKK
jgi:hypothetical protein